MDKLLNKKRTPCSSYTINIMWGLPNTYFSYTGIFLDLKTQMSSVYLDLVNVVALFHRTMCLFKVFYIKSSNSRALKII